MSKCLWTLTSTHLISPYNQITMEPQAPMNNPAPFMPEPMNTPTPQAPEHKSGTGPIVGAVVVIALLIFGGLYFWGSQLEKNAENLPLITGDTAPVQDNRELSRSDSTDAITNDADDAYMNQLEANIEADLQAIESF